MDLYDAAQKAVRAKNAAAGGAGTFLLEKLYNACCGLRGAGQDGFELLRRRMRRPDDAYYVYSGAANELCTWYRERYHDGFGMAFGSKGITRSITRKTTFDTGNSLIPVSAKKNAELFRLPEGEARRMGYVKGRSGKYLKRLYGTYDFDKLYDRQQFHKYLTDGGQGNDFQDFILHTAVAFLLSPRELDTVLQHYGCQPLHVKNIHHLAIYAVLHDTPDRTACDQSRNPFREVRALYQSARDVVNSAPPAALSPNGGADGEEAAAFSGGSTRRIRNYLVERENINKDNLLAYISRHRQVYDMRHSRLLAEHRNLARLFSVLYDDRRTPGQEGQGGVEGQMRGRGVPVQLLPLHI